MKKKTYKKSFIQGSITAEFIGNSIAKHQTKTSIGAHNILGQVPMKLTENSSSY